MSGNFKNRSVLRLGAIGEYLTKLVTACCPIWRDNMIRLFKRWWYGPSCEEHHTWSFYGQNYHCLFCHKQTTIPYDYWNII